MTIPITRVRTRRPKTKSGCKTCRIRRIKCDETKPACDRCTANGWICDGYRTDVVATRPADPGMKASRIADADRYALSIIGRPWYLPLSRLNNQEGQAYAFFRQHTANQLQDGVKSQLWNRWAMQISHQEPAILHGIIAVGAMHNARSTYGNSSPSGLQQIALGSYSKAVTELRDRMSALNNRPGVDIVLLACILFVGFEMLQNETMIAMEHLQIGLKIMTDKCSSNSNARDMGTRSILIKGSPEHLLDELVPIFVRLDYGAPMFGRRHAMLDLAHDEYNLRHSLSVPTSFDSLLQAKSYLDLLSSGVFRLRGELCEIAERVAVEAGFVLESYRTTCYTQTLSRSVDLGSDWHRILARKQSLEAGCSAFWRSLDTFMASDDHSQDRAAMAVQIQYVLVFFTLTNCREAYETMCDGFGDLFEMAITLCERYIESAPGFTEFTGQRNLSLEPGVMPTIFLIAGKCRHPAIRNRAISLLDVGCRQEAIWDGKPFAVFMQHFVDLENSRVASCSGADVARWNTVYPCALDHPEYARFSDVVIADDFDKLGRGTYFCSRYRHETDRQIEVVQHKVDFSGQIFGKFCAWASADSLTTPKLQTDA